MARKEVEPSRYQRMMQETKKKELDKKRKKEALALAIKNKQIRNPNQ
jgi:hypothetical protein